MNTHTKEIPYELTDNYNFEQQDKSEIVTFQDETNDNAHPNSSPSPY